MSLSPYLIEKRLIGQQMLTLVTSIELAIISMQGCLSPLKVDVQIAQTYPAHIDGVLPLGKSFSFNGMTLEAFKQQSSQETLDTGNWGRAKMYLNMISRYWSELDYLEQRRWTMDASIEDLEDVGLDDDLADRWTGIRDFKELQQQFS